MKIKNKMKFNKKKKQRVNVFYCLYYNFKNYKKNTILLYFLFCLFKFVLEMKL